MRTVTHALLTSAAILMGAAAASAQLPDRPRPAVLITEGRSGPQTTLRAPAAVLERLASFDANHDRRISRDELPERMQNLVVRGDTDGDGALDPDETQALVRAASAVPTRFVFHSQGFDGMAGVIKDLKLEPAKHARALAIAGNLQLPVKEGLPAALDEAMRALLDEEEYANFVAAAMRLSRSPVRGFSGVVVGGVVPGIEVQTGRQ